ncbi:hypothetical protein [Streptomyces sp. NPDC088923]|uniref:hypothetical protein n=1 Tax=Streptomyces sp. NPDC088923 TaxID=3365913 RepID=UPI00382963C7
MPQDETGNTEDTQTPSTAPADPGALGSAVRVCLAPLALEHPCEGVVEYVLRGTGPEALAPLYAPGSPKVAKMVAGGGVWAAADVSPVADVHPGWSPDAADAARLTVYGDAPAGILARFGHVLDALTHAEPGRLGSGAWLATLTDSALTAVRSRSEASQRVGARWGLDLLSEIALAGEVPGRTPAHAALATVLDQRPGEHWNSRLHLLGTGAAETFLARHADVLAEVAITAGSAERKSVALRCAGIPEPHAALLAALAVDEDRFVRAEALAALGWLAPGRQVELLVPHLRTAGPEELAAVLRRLADIEGGDAAIEDVLNAPGGEPLDAERAQALRRTVERASLTRGPGPVVPVPPVNRPTDADVLAELGSRPAAARREGSYFWPRIEERLPLIPDVRAVRDALREAGMTDADRRVASLLTNRNAVGRNRLLGAVLTPEDAERWWPLFAERLDLADEYLDGGYRKGDADDETVDTTDMTLTILARFPVAPGPLRARLTALALGTSRHRLTARRVLRDDAEALAAARVALNGTGTTAEATVRASAAEWLAGLGEPDLQAPPPGWEFGEDVLSPATRVLPAPTLWWLDRFKEEALGQGVPAPDVDRWLGLARPMLRTAPDGGGPVRGRLGGPLMLPPDVPALGGASAWDEQLIVTLDFATVPEGATDLPLPPDGKVLLFANADLEPEPEGGAVYVPAGAPVEEREVSLNHYVYEYGTPEKLDADLRRTGDLRLVPGVSLPTTPPEDEMLARHPHAEALREIWSEQTDGGGEWQLGGHADNFDDYGDPVAASAYAEAGKGPADPADWVLLAQWAGFPMAILYWTIPRQDLAAGRFDRVVVQMHSNP